MLARGVHIPTPNTVPGESNLIQELIKLNMAKELYLGGALSTVRAQRARAATIWVSGGTGDPCFEIIGASLLPCCVGFDAFSTLGI